MGDIQGIIERLDYLRELGVDALWLSPIFPSPMADFGYDVSNYCDVDPRFGTLETFDQLLAAAHDRGLRVILDYVGNHTSIQHPWFIESRSSRHNLRRNWYIWKDAAADGGPPNNWPSFFGGSAWTWDETTKQYYLHLFSAEQPDLNWRHPLVAAAMQDVLRFWLNRGVDGFRMDAVTLMIKHPQLPDLPSTHGLHGIDLLQHHVYVHNQPVLHSVLRALRRVVDSYPGDRVLLGETGDLDPRRLMSYYGRHLDELQLPHNFIPMHTPWRAADMKQAIADYLRALPPQATPNFVFGNHDTSRPATRYGRENHRSVAMLLLTLPGVATLYYGDELGMTDGHLPPERVQDLVTQQPGGPPLPARDPARTPMPWNAAANGGFTLPDREPWLPLAGNHEAVNVAHQEADPGSTLHFYRRLIALRRHTLALRYGSCTLLEGVPPGVMAYLRQSGPHRFLILINFASEAQLMDLSSLAPRAELRLSSGTKAAPALDVSRVDLPAHASMLLQLVE